MMKPKGICNLSALKGRFERSTQLVGTKRKQTNPKTRASSLVALLITILMLSAFAELLLVSPVSAAGYTEYVGTLSGANNFVVRFPDQWNGMLAVVCRGSSTTPVLDARTSFYNSTANNLLPQGFAVAASNYGPEGGESVAMNGFNTTYQLTKYIIDTYHVSGKIFLVDVSLGGAVALLLAEKYPNTFSGVLDLSGVKDWKVHYEYKTLIASMNLSEIRSYVLANCGASPLAVTDTDLQALKDYCNSSATNLVKAAGGTPQTKPNEYELISPTYHANITVPVITVHGSGDKVTPFSQSTLYKAAVASTGRSFLYRLYAVPPVPTGSGHADANVLAQSASRFAELVRWSNELDSNGPLAASTFSSTTVFASQTWYFCVHANGGISPYKFQWYEGNTAISGQTGMVIAASKPAPGTYTYYCKITDARGKTADSSPVTLIVR